MSKPHKPQDSSFRHTYRQLMHGRWYQNIRTVNLQTINFSVFVEVKKRERREKQCSEFQRVYYIIYLEDNGGSATQAERFDLRLGADIRIHHQHNANPPDDEVIEPERSFPRPVQCTVELEKSVGVSAEVHDSEDQSRCEGKRDEMSV